ncbi:MAG: hypothetical protein F4106_12875 [Gemmatimonadetes bacterium]|nr:hypothetical protein [Gemmatimonadota bacterium]MXX70893.1 hypothetical protein [Gemmatimonadota bacterium]MYC92644.1 hypothetical protein [Gemmatimonadota bacterium]MYG36882.1 hypothetical protein [Gemmatimonadota bacterium]MYJ18904.1 hypothetical protein [Gemmatimonadota bacterium]
MTREDKPAGGRWIRTIFLWLVVAASLGLAAGVAGAVWISHTEAGREAALDWVLTRVRPAINGSITVGSMGPGGLFGGTTLHDVRLTDAAGHPVLAADSIRAQYSAAGMLGVPPGMAGLELWGAVVDLAPAAGGRVDLASLLASRDDGVDGGAAAADSEEPSPAFRIRNVGIRGASVVLREDDGTGRSVRGVEADVPLIEIRPEPDVFLAASVDRADLSYPLGAGTLDLSDIAGRVSIGGEGVLVDAERFRLPESEGTGRLVARSDGNRLRTDFDLEMSRLALADLGWIDERFDHGTARGRVRIEDDPAGRRIRFDGMEADLGSGGRITFGGELLAGDTIRLRRFRALPEAFSTLELDRYLPRELPVAGTLYGDLLFDGEAGNLGVAGEVILLDEAELDTLVYLSGSGTSLGPEGVSDVELEAAALDYSLLEIFVPRPEWRGRGDLAIRAGGALETGLAIEIAATQTLAGGPPSTVTLSGSLYGDTSVSVVDLSGSASPLSLSTLGELFPSLPLEGSINGAFSFRGPLDQLDFSVDLETDAGPIVAEGTVNAPDPADGYQVAASSDGLDLSRLLPGLPDSTVVAGRVTLDGRGLDPESLRGNLTLDTGPSTIGDLRVDSTELNAWVDDDGLLHVETVHARAAGLTVVGRGSIGVAPGVTGSGVTLFLSSPSIRPLRDVFMGPNLIAWDELPLIEQDLLIAVDGVDPDTFPRARDIRFEGRVDGEVRLDGGLEDLSATATVTLGGFRYGQAAARSLGVDLTVDGLAATAPSPSRAVVRGAVMGDSLSFRDREFRLATLEGEVTLGDRGRLRALIQRSENEAYDAQAVVQLGDQSGRVDLDRLTLVFDDRRWNLQGPARFDWDADAIEVSNFGLIRPGGGGLSLAADGRLVRGTGDSDFRLRAADLDLEVVGRLLQLESLPGGVLAAALDASGSGSDPEWQGTIRVDHAVYQTLLFDSVSMSGSYAKRRIATEIESWQNNRRTIRIAGNAPLDLRLTTVEERIPDRAVDLTIAADSFPARMVLDVLRSLEEVDGTVTGNVALGGRRSDLEPDGEIRLENAAALMAPFGVRLSSVEVDLDLSPDGVVRVAGTGTSGGTMEVEGTVDLGQLADSVPLDLTFRPRSFQIVDRADMEAAVSSEAVTLTGTYAFPVISGPVNVEDGTVFVEEFQRTSEVVDLYDPALFTAATAAIGSGEGEDDSVERLPFLQNLRVLINMHVERGNFLRSRQMNVETTGDLNLTFDRLDNQLVLAGDMEVERGTYSLGGRTLRMTDGVFTFVGTPGFNPGIAVTAESRLRTREGQPLVITADISGTLLSPFLSLSSDAESAMSEADLVNYLFLGRPTSALVGEAGAPVAAVGDLFLGQVFNEIGYLLGTGLGVDHISVSQSEQGQASAAFGASSLQLEVGKYLLDDLFLTGVFQRGFCTDPTLPRNSGGLRLEVGMPRDVRLEGFVEGRCTRERYRGLGDASLALENIWGFLMFREWGFK